MTTLSSRITALIRAWLRICTPALASLTPAHGWLLPTPEAVRTVRSARRAVPVANGCGR
jgi:hypothetical protein